MGYEIDFMAVGEGKRSGDAIALRLGNLHGPRADQTVVVIDGGTKESGQNLVSHIQKYYGTNKVDIVVSTHPDADHSSGLKVVLEQMQVGTLLMHLPWNHVKGIRAWLDEPLTKSKVDERIWRALENVRELENLAKAKNVPIREPFSDVFKFVLSPSKDFYEQQVAHFRCMPQPTQEVPTAVESIWGALKTLAKTIESWFTETLTDPKPEDTSGENNSSVVLLINAEDKSFLFTADAGVPALTEARNRAETLGIDLQTVEYVQVPHHGSKRNVGPTILNQIVGPIKQEETYEKTAFISAAKDGNPKHPAKKVVNAFRRRGARVYATQGNGLWQHSDDAPPRAGYGKATLLPFYEEVDD